ncbi:unnamed protein product [Protopolystoma xenopodis]|uniref:Uncharacterized protein n=1 Tax=Protopolystoma xenopodis TaxID=117903 RepID=A0A3S5FEA5_9PLAT|nr:unnamed protein product [Protopolystoma xenopodis]
MLLRSDDVRHMTDESLAPFHRNRVRLPRKRRQHECSSKAIREKPTLESLHATLSLETEIAIGPVWRAVFANPHSIYTPSLDSSFFFAQLLWTAQHTSPTNRCSNNRSNAPSCRQASQPLGFRLTSLFRPHLDTTTAASIRQLALVTNPGAAKLHFHNAYFTDQSQRYQLAPESSTFVQHLVRRG